jgi:RNA polymerase sigma-70 factor, ECF subfamily
MVGGQQSSTKLSGRLAERSGAGSVHAPAERPPAATLGEFLAGVERRAFRMAQIATSRREDALDLVQEAMTRLVERYADAPASDWPALFFRILGNAIHDWRRRRMVRDRVLVWFRPGPPADAGDTEGGSIADEWQGADPGAGPLERLEDQQALTDLVAALRELPLRQQQCFLLRAWEGLDVATTARAMGVSEGSVKTHYARANARLREALGGHWP